jgi:hypothetical protein
VADHQVALWFWRHHQVYVDLYDSERAAAEIAVHMSDNGDASITGVQFPDGSFVHWLDWPLAEEVRKEQDAYWDKVLEESKKSPKPLTRKIKTPFLCSDYYGNRKSRRDVTVPASYPDWLGHVE